MSLFNSSKKKKQKKREDLCADADIFIQIHYVRERDSDRYKYNTLPLKSDPDREACIAWYEEHGNPENFSEIATYLLNDSKFEENTLCEKYLLDKGFFTNLLSNPKYHPSKGEAIILCFAFHLYYEASRALLKSANYALTNSQKTDLVIRFFLENKEYSVNDLNFVLNHFELPKIKDL